MHRKTFKIINIMEIYNVIQESNVDGEILVNVTPCASMDVARNIIDEEVKTLVAESPAYKGLDINNPSDDFVVEKDDTHVFIKKANDDYYEDLKVEVKELVC